MLRTGSLVCWSCVALWFCVGCRCCDFKSKRDCQPPMHGKIFEFGNRTSEEARLFVKKYPTATGICMLIVLDPDPNRILITTRCDAGRTYEECARAGRSALGFSFAPESALKEPCGTCGIGHHCSLLCTCVGGVCRDQCPQLR